MSAERSYRILAAHPLNQERKAKGLHPGNCCWFWGAGTRPALCSFEEKTGKKGMMVSAVDLLKGIAVGAGMGVAHVEGATGGLDTNYAGKVEAEVNALFVRSVGAQTDGRGVVGKHHQPEILPRSLQFFHQGAHHFPVHVLNGFQLFCLRWIC